MTTDGLTAPGADLSPRTPRIVMIVDNTIDGDSRVQKSARFMASLGWEVFLVGRSPSTERQTTRLDAAVVIKAPTELTLHKRPTLAPRRTLKSAFAYRDKSQASAATLRAKWRKIDFDSYLATHTVIPAFLKKISFVLQRAMHRLRNDQFKRRVSQAKAPRRFAGFTGRSARNTWSYDDPFLADLELAIAPVLAELAPDLIHAHDYRSIGIAVRYADRCSRKGKRPPVVYDAHEFLPGIEGIADARKRRGNETYEAFYLRKSDAIITVAEGIRQELVNRHGLKQNPMIVANVPMARASHWSESDPDLRSTLGLPPEDKILVYVGGAAPRRGLSTVIQALTELHGVHFAILTKPGAYVNQLHDEADTLGVGDRFHVLPYVHPDQVSSFVRSANIGLSPLHVTLNHTWALPTKLFEYAHARLPIITSAVAASTEFVESNGIGKAFKVGDTEDFVRVVTDVLAHEQSFKERLNDPEFLNTWTWEFQCLPVDALYRALLKSGPSIKEQEIASTESTVESGHQPTVEQIASASGLLLGRADGHHLAKRNDVAAVDLNRASEVLFHRALHFDNPASPMTQDPSGFLNDWRQSPSVQDLAIRRRSEAKSLEPVDSVAILSHSNLSFIDSLAAGLSSLGIASTTVDTSKLLVPDVRRPTSWHIEQRLKLSTNTQPTVLNPELSKHIGSANTVWVEWCQRLAVQMSLQARSSQRLIVRLHSFEAFTIFPHLMDWSNVDDLVFVSNHIRDLIVPQLIGFDSSTTNVHVIPVGVDAASLHRQKSAGSAKTLAVLGWSAAAKDVTWAIDLLSLLLKQDPDFRLLIVGSEPNPQTSKGAQRYLTSALERAQQADVAHAIEFIPFTDDVPNLLTRVGVIVSSSVRESLHMAIVEGACSGAIPVVRNWPFFENFDAPRHIFPPEWVVDDLQQGVTRILEATSSAAFSQQSDRVATQGAELFDNSVISAKLGALFR